MQFQIIEETNTKMKIVFKGETHTFLNILRKELWNDPNVVLAAYRIQHPLKNEAEFILETNGKEKPREALINAVKRIIQKLQEFKQEYLKALNEFKS